LVVAVAGGGREREVAGWRWPGTGEQRYPAAAMRGRRRWPSSGEDDREVRVGEEAAALAARMMETTVHRSRSSSESWWRRSRSSSDWRRRSSARGLPPRPVQQRRRLGAVSMRRVQWARTWVKVNLAGLGAGACGIGFPLSTTVSCVPS
jgi:hypothetical protein